MTVVAKAPGKLFIAGEYAVVEPGYPAVLVAVNRFITVTLTESENRGRIHSSEYGMPVEWRRDTSGQVVVESQVDYVISAISTVERIREERGVAPAYFDLSIESELDDADGQKFGLGSSAAVVVATVSAMNTFYGLELTDLERFKLALLATIEISPRASGGDIAASTYGGWIAYSSPDRESLRSFAETHSVSESLEADGWRPFAVRRLHTPPSISLQVGWTGSPASTAALVGSVKKASPKDSPDYETFLQSSKRCVGQLVSALQADDLEGVTNLLMIARQNLLDLEASSGILIETDKLSLLCDIAERYGATGKPSGAGGGDCGIALIDSDLPVDSMLEEWSSNGIRPLNLMVEELS